MLSFCKHIIAVAASKKDGSWTYSLKSCIEQFNEEYPNNGISYKVFSQHKNRIVDRFENKSCICKGKSSGRPTILTDKVVDDVRQRIEASPYKSIRKLASQSGLSYSSARKALVKNLQTDLNQIYLEQQSHYN